MTGRTVVDQVALRAWVEDSCVEQGIPVHITDPIILSRIGRLLAVSTAPVGTSVARA